MAASALAGVTITTSAKTFQKAGGAASVVVQGDGAWTATSDSDWIVIKQGASGNGAGSCVYVVNANASADTRIGHINIGGNTYTITQYGYDATLTPTSATYDRHGGNGTFSVTVDAGISWTASANDSWITVSPSSGMSVGTVNYTVAAYDGIVSRVGSVTVGGKTFTITQTGVDVSISPESVMKGEGSDIISVTVRALAGTQWTVTPNASWISVLDKESGYGDYDLTLAINSNPSFQRRTGTVSIGSATLTISQDGTVSAFLSIDPPTATAAATGAYGNIAVYATPDAAWTAQSLTPWLTISEGTTGAGNGNIKYVVSANPTLSERTGQIVVVPPYKVIEPDLYRGLLFWITSQYNTVGTESRSTTKSLSQAFDGSFNNPLSGASIPSGCTFSFSFKLDDVNRINRLITLGTSIYLDEEQRIGVGSGSERVMPPCSIATNTWYTMVVKHNSKAAYFGKRGEGLKQFTLPTFTSIPTSVSSIKLGYCQYPTTGNLTGGQFANLRCWNRALTDAECRHVDLNQNVAMSEDDVPLGAPSGIKWDYFPLDGNAYRTKNTSMTALVQDTALSGWNSTADRYNAAQGAIASTGNGTVTISNFHNVFGSSELDATYSLWINVANVPSGDVSILRRTTYNSNSNTTYDPKSGGYVYGNFLLSLTSSRQLKFFEDVPEICQTTFNTTVSTNEWHMITVVGKSGKSMQMFLDGVEIGNISSSFKLGYYKYSSNHSHTFILGGWDGAADGLTFFHSALTAAQVRELYERQRQQRVVHTVTQGKQSPQIDKTTETAPAEGSTSSVRLTLAQSVQWTAQSNNSWIQIDNGTVGAGSATIEFSVDANPAVTSRSGSITVAGKTLTIVQEGLWADVTTDDTSFGVESDSGTLWVDTEGGGTWTASADVDWIHLFDESGAGSSPVMFVVDDYLDTTSSRSGTITIAGKKVIITQQGYELSIDPQVTEVGSNAGAGEFGVSVPIDAVWEAIADCSWITIIGARTGVGDGVIQYTIADNLTGETRTGRIIIAGKAYTITQKTTLPVTTKAIGNGTITGAGDYDQGTPVTLTATPAAGYVFSHWSGDAVGVTNVVSISVDVPKEVTATFIPESAAEQLAAAKAAQGGFYTRDQIHALEVGNLVLDVDSATGTARVGVQLMETSNLSDPNSWRPVGMSAGNLDVGSDGTVGLNVPATGNAKFFKVVVPER